MQTDRKPQYLADILVVDDTLDSLRLLTRMLTEQGYNVRPLSDGKKAVTVAKMKRPDLILLDILMPGIDGYTICEHLKADDYTRDIPVIFMSALHETFNKVRAFSTGGIDYITKPFQVEEVLARIKTHLALRDMQKRLETQNVQLEQEIVERKRAEEQIRQQKQLLENTLESLPYPFYVIDVHDYSVKIANSEALKLIRNLSPPYPPCYAFAHQRGEPCQGGESPCPLETVKRTHKPVVVEHMHTNTQGEAQHVEVYGFPIFDEAGNVAQMIEYTLDVTDRKQREQELEELNQQLQAANASKDRFFSMIAHDLRSPFTSLLGLSEIAIHYDDSSKEELREIMKLIKSSAELVYARLENLLTWSRLQLDMMDYTPAHLSLHELVEPLIQHATANATHKQITLHNTLSEDMIVYADTKMLSMVIRNLLSNAIKFTKPGGCVEVLARENRHDVELSIADTGIGISAEDLPKLFRVDSRLKTPGTSGEHGTGLGLLLCHDLLKKNNGSIEVESVVGEGTTVRCRLPKGSPS
ncbi:response regulator [candidate division KSB3 bacterium]|uniref:histidine kinase n=1 Tax=candidate division KSB3 bacterium TaxID=2044937 RepID=A0A9D5JTU9_9BACT|nr:response regulator [candidate division KSB3 bacterium]MBD3324138.1 response regulator [candidate division KSB3 bacterium]